MRNLSYNTYVTYAEALELMTSDGWQLHKNLCSPIKSLVRNIAFPKTFLLSL